ncbi:MAG: rhomboid family intramembrane serine protease [Firmicutes bacterium]|nr:rhomboid family intramembrane serine protease [Bacillota bacterium]
MGESDTLIRKIENILTGEFAYIHPEYFSADPANSSYPGFDSILVCSDDTGVCYIKKMNGESLQDDLKVISDGMESWVRIRNRKFFKYRQTLVIMISEQGISKSEAGKILKIKGFGRKNNYYPLIVDGVSGKIYCNLAGIPLLMVEMVLKLKKELSGKLTAEKKRDVSACGGSDPAQDYSFDQDDLARIEAEHKTVKRLSDFRFALFKSHKYVTLTLIIINILLWVFLKLRSDEVDSTTLLEFGAKAGPLIWQGEIWRFLSPLFLHVTLMHLISNCALLLMLGGLLEALVGRWRLVLIWLLSGIAGNMLSLAFSPYLSVGASSGVFGIFGALVVYGYLHKDSIPRHFYRLIMLFLLPFIVYNLVVGFMYGQSDNFAHLGGFIGGALVCSAMGVQFPAAENKGIRWKAAGVVCLVFGVCFLYVMKPYDKAYSIYYMVRGGERITEKDYAQSSSYLSQSIELNPDNESAGIQLGQVYFEAGNSRYKRKNFKAACVYYQKALHYFPFEVRFYPVIALTNEKLGDCLSTMGDNTGALKKYRYAAVLKPGDLRLKQLISFEYRVLANESFEQFDYDKAIELCKKSIESDSENFEARKMLGFAYYRKGMLPQAGECWKSALDMNPGMSEFYRMLQELIFKNLISCESGCVTGKVSGKAFELNKRGEEILRQSGDFQKAEKFFLEASQIDHSFTAPLLNIAGIHLALNLSNEAEIYTEKAMKLAPSSPDVLIMLARIAMNREKYSDAGSLLEKCLKQKPDSSQCLGWKGILARRMKKNDLAEKNLAKSVEIEPNNILFRIELARACYENGNLSGFYNNCNEALVYAASEGREEMALYIRMLLREKSEKRI